MSKVDWSKAPEWAECVVIRTGYHYHWSELPRSQARMMKIETGTNFSMSDPALWRIVEHRPNIPTLADDRLIESGYATRLSVDEMTKYKQPSLADLFTPVEQPSTAPELLNHAAQLLAERGQQYDKSGNERSAAKIVAAFNAVTGRDLTPGEGWLFMVLLKAVRFYSNTEIPHRDSLEDMIAYAALHAEEYLNDK